MPLLCALVCGCATTSQDGAQDGARGGAHEDRPAAHATGGTNAAAAAPRDQAETLRAPASHAEAYRAVLEAELALQRGELEVAAQLLREATLHDERSAYLRQRLAEAYLAAGDTEHARRVVQDALRISKDDVGSWRLLGAVEVAAAQRQSARAAYEHALGLRPGDAETSMQLADLLVSAGDLPAAERVVDAWMAHSKGTAEGYVGLAQIFARRGDLVRARVYVDRALQRASEDASALRLRANLLEANGAFAEAAASVELLLHIDADANADAARAELLTLYALAGDTARSEAEARAWLADGDEENARLQIGEAWLRAGDAARAVRSVDVPRAPRRVRLALARFLLAAGDAAQSAATLCKQLPAVIADDAAAEELAVCSAALTAGDRHAEAAALVLTALSQPSAPLAVVDAAVELAAQTVRSPSASVRALTGALNTAIDTALAPLLAATPGEEILDLAARRKETEGDNAARTFVEDLLRARPRDVALLRVYARVLDAAAEHTLAADVLERALQAAGEGEPTRLSDLNFLAFALAEARTRNDEAIVYARRAIARAPLDAAIVDTLGWAELQGGASAAALTTLQRAAVLSPREPEILFHVATAQHATGDHAAAVATAQRARAGALHKAMLLSRIDALLADAQRGSP